MSNINGNQLRHAFLDTNGVMQDLGTLVGDSTSEGLGLNDIGQVVGASSAANGTYRGFILSNGVMTDLNSLLDSASVTKGWSIKYASAINNSGQITGAGTVNGEEHAFLLTPDTQDGGTGGTGGIVTPLPSTARAGLLFLCGMGLLRIVRWPKDTPANT